MALTTGAEVQKPFATVVIRGLPTAALLTLLVLPVLHARLASRAAERRVATVDFARAAE